MEAKMFITPMWLKISGLRDWLNYLYDEKRVNFSEEW